jgi:hypothetical protein
MGTMRIEIGGVAIFAVPTVYANTMDPTRPRVFPKVLSRRAYRRKGIGEIQAKGVGAQRSPVREVSKIPATSKRPP